MKKDLAFIFRRADAYFAVSAPLLRQVAGGMRKAAVRGSLLPCHVELTRFHVGMDVRERTRRRLGWNDRIVLCYAGGIQAYQCIRETFGLAAALRRLEPSVSLLVLTPDCAGATALGVEQVGKRGVDYEVMSASADEVPELMAACDVGLLLRDDAPLNAVASPTKFGEYLASGCPLSRRRMSATRPRSQNRRGADGSSWAFTPRVKNWKRWLGFCATLRQTGTDGHNGREQ